MEDGKDDWVSVIEMSKKVRKTSSYGSIRKFIFLREFNGASHWIRKIHGKLFTSPSRFYEWIEKEGKL